MRYAELRARTNASFLSGASRPEEMVAAAHALGYEALAVADVNELGGAVRARAAAKPIGLKLLIGAELTLLDAPPVVLLAKDRAGYGRLCRLLTESKRSRPRGDPGLPVDRVLATAEGLLAILTASPGALVARRFVQAFGDDVALAVTRNYLPGEEAALAQSRASGLPLVATGDARFHDPTRKPLADVLAAIHANQPLSACGYRLPANAERCLRPPEETLARFRAIGLMDAVDRARRMAERCTFTMDELRFVYPEKLLPAGETPLSYFDAVVRQGARERYGPEPSHAVTRQLEHELALIGRLKVEGFFLTMYDIVRFARSRGILCQGRGSAANSVVCYALAITSVEPVGAGLLFERFISEERGEPPDIDVDFEHERREEVIQWVFERYGREHAGMVCENICYRLRSAIRDVGKALGLSQGQVDRLAKGMSHYDHAEALDDPRIRDAGIDPASPAALSLREHVTTLLDFPRHRGTHVGGMVVTNDPLVETAPLENAAMAGRTLLPWDKDDCDALGLCKFDLLGLGILTAIRRAFELVERHDGRRYTLATIPQGDALTYERVQVSDTVGAFQIESRAQMSTLPRLKPRMFYDLVVTISLIRPGPIQGGMVHPYLRRRNGEEPVTFPHPALVPILARTLGVPLFQEQVMRMAVEVAGFTPGEADQLRRAMGAWRKRGTMDVLREKLLRGMTSRGITSEYAGQIYRQIEGFGEYGFPESHAISFALLAYASMWLKVHHPAAYAAALLNSQPMGFYAPHTLVDDAKRHAVVVLPADVNRSGWDCDLEGGAIRLGLRMVGGLGAKAQDRIEAGRQGGPYASVEDFARRTGLDRGALSKLAHAGAFRSLPSAEGRRAAFWEVLRPRTDDDLALADDPQVAFTPMTALEEVRADYKTTGLSAACHPVGFLREHLTRLGVMSVDDTLRLRDGRRISVAGLVIARQHPQTAKGFVFLSLEDETGILNVIVSPQLFARQRAEATRSPLLCVKGTLQNKDGAPSLKAASLHPLTWPEELPAPSSRDFR